MSFRYRNKPTKVEDYEMKKYREFISNFRFYEEGSRISLADGTFIKIPSANTQLVIASILDYHLNMHLRKLSGIESHMTMPVITSSIPQKRGGVTKNMYKKVIRELNKNGFTSQISLKSSFDKDTPSNYDGILVDMIKSESVIKKYMEAMLSYISSDETPMSLPYTFNSIFTVLSEEINNCGALFNMLEFCSKQGKLLDNTPPTEIECFLLKLFENSKVSNLNPKYKYMISSNPDKYTYYNIDRKAIVLVRACPFLEDKEILAKLILRYYIIISFISLHFYIPYQTSTIIDSTRVDFDTYTKNMGPRLTAFTRTKQFLESGDISLLSNNEAFESLKQIIEDDFKLWSEGNAHTMTKIIYRNDLRRVINFLKDKTEGIDIIDNFSKLIEPNLSAINTRLKLLFKLNVQ